MGEGSTDRFATRIRLMSIWHVVGSVACFAGLLLASRGGDDELPWMPRFALQGVFLTLTIVNVATAYGIATTKRWARSSSLVVNYLLTVVASAATLHQFNAFRALGNLGDGLYKAFVPFLFVLLGLIVVLVALQLLADRPTAPTLLRVEAGGVDHRGARRRVVRGRRRPDRDARQGRGGPDPTADARMPRRHDLRSARVQGDVVACAQPGTSGRRVRPRRR